MRYLVGLIVILFLPIFCYGETVQLTGMRIQPAEKETRITFYLSKKTAGKIRYLTPNLISLEFENTVARFKMHHAKLNHANVTQLDTNFIPPNTLQILLSVKSKVHWQIKLLTEEKIRLELEIISTENSAPQKQNITQTFSRYEPKSMLNPSLISADIDALLRQQQKIITIVIDAGHGGKDTGALGANGALEKNIALSVAKKLAAEINSIPHMRAKLTRSGDYFVTLRDRLRLARKEQADLFVSIHADGYFDNLAKGASVYALSRRGATTAAAKFLANQERYPELDGVQFNSLQDNSYQLRSVLLDLAQTATIHRSLRLGQNVLSHLDDFSSLHHHTVEQAPFLVLKAPDVPSILVETGFITNPYEAIRLNNPTYQKKLAHAIWLGIKDYLNQIG